MSATSLRSVPQWDLTFTNVVLAVSRFSCCSSASSTALCWCRMGSNPSSSSSRRWRAWRTPRESRRTVRSVSGGVSWSSRSSAPASAPKEEITPFMPREVFFVSLL
eukprot:1223307-Rhodomonas_salina.2